MINDIKHKFKDVYIKDVFSHINFDLTPKEIFESQIKNKISNYFLLKISDGQIVDIKSSSEEPVNSNHSLFSGFYMRLFENLIQCYPNITTELIFTNLDDVDPKLSGLPIFSGGYKFQNFSMPGSYVYNIPIMFDLHRDYYNVDNFYQSIKQHNTLFHEKKHQVYGRHGLAGMQSAGDVYVSTKGQLFFLSKIYPEIFNIKPIGYSNDFAHHLLNLLPVIQLIDVNEIGCVYQLEQLKHKINVLCCGNSFASETRTFFSLLNNGYTFLYGPRKAVTVLEIIAGLLDCNPIKYFTAFDEFVTSSVKYLNNNDEDYFKHKNRTLSELLTHQSITNFNFEIIQMYNDLYKIPK